jgi:hypothetical protein
MTFTQITPIQTALRSQPQEEFDEIMALFMQQLPATVTQMNAAGLQTDANATAAAASQLAAAANAVSAASSAAIASTASAALMFNPLTNYTQGQPAKSGVNFRAYLRRTAGVSATDPANDPANWVLVPVPMAVSRIALAVNTTLAASHSGSLIDCTGSLTLTFSASNLLGDGWCCFIRNGSGDTTVQRSGADLIDARTSYIMYPGEVRFFQCDGAGNIRSFVINAFRRSWLTSGTVSLPPGYKGFRGKIWGAGGGRYSTPLNYASAGLGAGAGGACLPFFLTAAALGVSQAFVCGAGGVPGAVGGSSTFGGLTIYGGGPGSSVSGGAGGGAFSAGGPGTLQGRPVNAGTSNPGSGGASGGVGGTPAQPGDSGDGGAGGGDSSVGAYSATAGKGGNAINGGAGGSTSSVISDNVPGGDSIFGGDGGWSGFLLRQVQSQALANLVARTFNLDTTRQNGDLSFVVMATSSPGDSTPPAPAGYALQGSYSGGTGSYALNSGTRRVSVFARIIDGSETTSQSYNQAGFEGSIIASYHIPKQAGVALSFAIAGGADNTAGTGWSVTTGNLDVAAGDFVFAFSAYDHSSLTAGTESATFTLAGTTIGDVLPNGWIASGSTPNIALAAAAARVSSGAANAACTYAMTMSSTSGSSPAGATAVLRIRGAAALIDGQQPAGGCGGLGKKGGDGQLDLEGVI